MGSVEWAVVTRHLVPSGLFVRLEESGEEAFVDIVSVHDHPLCRNPEVAKSLLKLLPKNYVSILKV